MHAHETLDAEPPAEEVQEAQLQLVFPEFLISRDVAWASGRCLNLIACPISGISLRWTCLDCANKDPAQREDMRSTLAADFSRLSIAGRT